jgi:predicted Zn finger-like uncharacterized protein
MKFSCERCQTRYSIGDDKVRGKVLKIRCKTCGHIVVVREQLPTVQGEASGYAVPQMASAGTGSVSITGGTGPSVAMSSSPPPQAGGVEWFIAIKGKQHGPASADEVARLYREGQITERSYLWHEGLPAWTRLKELPAFASLVAEGPAPARRPPLPPPPPPEGAEIVNFEAARAQRQQQQQREQPAPVMNDPFAAVAPGPDGHHEAPRDSTRVFIMQAGLHNRGTKHKMYAGIAAAAAVGLIALVVIDYQLDILGLRQVVDAVAEKTGIREAPPEDPGAGWDDVDADPTLKCQLMPDPAACIKEAKARAQVARTGRKKPTSTGAAVSDDDLKGAFGSGAGGTTTATGAVAAVGGDGFVSVGTGTPSKEDIDRMLKGGKGGPTGPKARIELPATIGSSIDAENAKKVVQDGQGGIQLCVDSTMKMGEDIPGKVIFTLTIGQKGSVERAVANNAVVGASSLGGCLAATMKKWKFAPPTEPTDLDIPLILR